jgi:hypothetical protein
MKMRAILAGAFALAAASAVSNAAIIVTATNAGTVDGYTDWVFHITGWTAPDATTVGGNSDGVTVLDGTFSVSGGGMISAPGTTNSNAGNKMNNSGTSAGAVTPPDSYVNFDSILASSTNPFPTFRDPNNTTPNSIEATWFTSGGPSNLPDTRLAPTQLANNPGAGMGVNGANWDSTLLGEIFATPGDVVSFVGKVSTKAQSGQAETFSTPVPEPASIGLLVLGAGLLARRRK